MSWSYRTASRSGDSGRQLPWRGGEGDPIDFAKPDRSCRTAIEQRVTHMKRAMLGASAPVDRLAARFPPCLVDAGRYGTASGGGGSWQPRVARRQRVGRGGSWSAWRYGGLLRGGDPGMPPGLWRQSFGGEDRAPTGAMAHRSGGAALDATGAYGNTAYGGYDHYNGSYYGATSAGLVTAITTMAATIGGWGYGAAAPPAWSRRRGSQRNTARRRTMLFGRVAAGRRPRRRLHHERRYTTLRRGNYDPRNGGPTMPARLVQAGLWRHGISIALCLPG